MHPLDGPRLKLQRAEEHLDALDREMDVFTKSDPYSVTLEGQDQQGRYVFRFDVRQQPPEHIGLTYGDAVTNMRAALDYIMWQLALRERDGKRPPRNTAFPIYLERKDFKAMRKRRNNPLMHIGEPARKVIEGFQPYHGSEGHDVYKLLWLNDLAIADKHQVLSVVIARGGVRGDDGRAVSLGHAIEDGDRLAITIEPADHERTLEIFADVGVEVRRGIIGATGLREIHTYHRDVVVPAFAGFFEEPDEGGGHD